MTMPERLAWAHANGVQPPDWVLQSNSEQLGGENTAAIASAEKCCINKVVEKPAGCDGHCCCRREVKSSDTNPTTDTENSHIQKRSASGWISLIQAQRCRGASTEWVASGAVLISATVCEVRRDMTATFFQLRVAAVAEAPPVEPAVPPPRMPVV